MTKNEAATAVPDTTTQPWNNGGSDGGYIEWNGAVVTGQPCEEFDALMKRKVRITLGNQYVAPYPKGKRSTNPGQWTAIEGTWNDLAEGAASSKYNNYEGWGLTKHYKGERKDGMSYVLGEAPTGNREKLAMRDMAAMGLDLDEGVNFDDVLDAVEELGFACFIYSSFNHLKTNLDVSYSAIYAVAKGEAFNDEMVRDHLRQKKPHLGESFIREVIIREEKLDIGNGFVVRCDCPPIHKLRLIFPLSETINVAELHDDPVQGPGVWKAKVRGLASLLGVHHDSACEDPSRLFYTARHRPDDERFCCVVFRAPPLKWDDIPANADNVWTQAGGSHNTNTIPEGVFFGDVSVTDLYRRYGKRWNIADLLEHTDAHLGWLSVNSKSTVDCPYREINHSNKELDSATFARNAGDSAHGFAVVHCAHDSCKTSNPHTVQYLRQWLDDGFLTVVMLEDPSFMEPLPNEGEGPFMRLTPIECTGEDEARDYFREHGVDAPAEPIIQKIVDMGGETGYACQRVDEARETVKRQLNGWDADRNVDPISDAKKDLTAFPDILSDLHDPEWLDDEGFLVTREKHPDVYKRHGVSAKHEDAEAAARNIIREQMTRSMTDRFDWVVVDGQAKVAIRQGPGRVVKMWKDSTLEKLYRNRWVSYSTDKGVVKQIKPHEVFAGARQRETFVGTCFAPELHMEEANAYNLWTGFAVQPSEGEWGKMDWHIRHILCDGDGDCYNFVMTYLASLFQRPGQKIPAALAFIGEQGTGKSKVFDWVRRGIGAAALKVSSARHLTGNFNAHLDGKIFITCEEAFWAGDKAAEGTLKDIISSDTLQIEGKFENVVERPNTVNPVFISNNEWIVPTDGEDARRFLVQRVSMEKKQDARYFGAIDDEMENGGLEAMVYALMQWDPTVIGGWGGLRNPPKTDALRQQAGMSLEGPASILMDIIRTGSFSGSMPDHTTFYYALSESAPTVVSDQHLKAVLCPKGGRGNIARAANKAICDLLGNDAHSGDSKAVVSYRQRSNDNTPEDTVDRVRYVTFPSLNDLQDIVSRYGG